MPFAVGDQAFYIVEFIHEKTVDYVPGIWLVGDKKTYWPKNNLVKRRDSGERLFEGVYVQHDIRILGAADSCLEARNRARRAENTSTLEDDCNQLPNRRRIIKRRFCSSSSSSDEDAGICTDVRKFKEKILFPSPPLVDIDSDKPGCSSAVTAFGDQASPPSKIKRVPASQHVSDQPGRSSIVTDFRNMPSSFAKEKRVAVSKHLSGRAGYSFAATVLGDKNPPPTMKRMPAPQHVSDQPGRSSIVSDFGNRVSPYAKVKRVAVSQHPSDHAGFSSAATILNDEAQPPPKMQRVPTMQNVIDELPEQVTTPAPFGTLTPYQVKTLRNQAEIKQLLKMILQKVSVGRDQPVDDGPEIPIQLPARTIAELKALIRWTESSSSNCRKLVSTLSHWIYYDAGTSARAMVSHIMSKEVAKDVNWCGRGGKMAFGKTQVADALITAVKQGHKLTKIDEVVRPLQEWLKHA